MIHSVERFLVAYILVFVASCLIVSLDTMDFTETFTSVAATLNNIGPGLGIVGPAGNYSSLSILSKSVLMFDMLAGRLEILPMLVLLLRMMDAEHKIIDRTTKEIDDSIYIKSMLQYDQVFGDDVSNDVWVPMKD